MFLASVIYAQVGINTASPTQTLDVNGNVRFRTVPQYSTLLPTDLVMVLDADGVGKRLPVTALHPPGKYTLDDVYSIVAANPVDRDITGSWPFGSQVNNLNIGMTISVVIPANKDVQVVVNYSVPLGMGGNFDCANAALLYYGVRFLKNGIEMPAGSRKFSFPAGSNGAKMSTISASYIERIENNSSSDMTVVYSLNGYLELSGTTGSPCIVRYNMQSASGENYNWGKATMSAQLYKKDL
ncbi:hypothetical protein [Chryseobacterium sp. 2VB]|uniref:hypothetical protein n=1 Tax=Chryseobacterium sp. 2VB TaxID=2502204 RepID=UPI0010F79F47|nr:hypothetical protein [Chryseobacterium sp. 2VB]